MKYFSINMNAKTPLYQQIIDSVKHGIDHHDLRHLDPLPSESQIALMFHISPIVVKQAYQILKEMGLIQTIKGKGSFIDLRPRLVINYLPFSKENWNRFHAVPFMFFGQHPASEKLRLQFKLPHNVETWHFKRIVSEQGFPYLYQSAFMPIQPLMKNIKPNESNDDFLSFLQTHTPLEQLKMTYTYQPTDATEEVALALDVKIEDPIHQWRINFFDQKQMIAIAYYHFPADYVTLRRDD
jgi:DNA-binding GntR family transcriptional regulator